jgi:NAD(P)-dependent dehydrogenase (short-subunit alcohol dehydrogenase family)
MSEDRTALITGASSGFGRGLVSELLARGWTVIATLRDAEGRRGLFEEELRQYPDRLVLASLDVAERGEREAVASLVEGRERGLDCLVNNAGYGAFGALEDISEEQLRWQMEVNVLGLVLLTRALLPALRERSGRIINVSSILGVIAVPLGSAYVMSKWALEGFTEALHLELAPFGMPVVSVQPGGFRTGFGDNMTWGEGDTEAYRGRTARFRAMQQKRLTSTGTPPAAVVRKLARLCEQRRPPRRVQVGRGAQLGWLLRRALPDRLHAWLTAAVLRRALPSGPT